MSTRKKLSQDGPISQNRFMSSPEYSDARGLNGVAVAAKASIQKEARSRSLIWFLHGRIAARGGAGSVAEDLIEMFRDRICGCSYGDLHPFERLRLTLTEAAHEWAEPRPPRDKDWDCEDKAECLRVAKSGNDEDGENWIGSVEDYITHLCIDPALPVCGCQVPYFRDFIEALFLYKEGVESNARDNFQQTAISRKIWAALDFALKTRKMVLIDGLEGRGKTEAIKAWCAFHLGEARFVSLKGITSKTTALRVIARALGVASSYCRTATEMQTRIEDVLSRSQIMLVLDEAHFLFSQGQRIYNRPELIDWIDTAICNENVPVALVTTPQFLICMNRAAEQVGWNWRQFRRRVKRLEKLPDKNTPEDISAVARSLLPDADAAAIKLVVGYATISKRDLSAVGDVAEQSKVIAEDAGARKVTFRHVEQAINDYLIPSDRAFVEGLAAGAKKSKARKPVGPSDT